jgi:hypothetical protein
MLDALSAKLKVINHLLFSEACFHQEEEFDNLAHRSRGAAPHDAAMMYARSGECKKVRVRSHDDPVGIAGKVDVRSVGRAAQACLIRRRDINAAPAQRRRHGRMNMFVKMKPHPHLATAPAIWLDAPL